jgi:ATP-dependent Clp protease adapter protein ClpS
MGSPLPFFWRVFLMAGPPPRRGGSPRPAREGGSGGPGVKELEPETETETEEEIEISPGEGWAVILFNDDNHDMMEVAVVLHLATGFDLQQCWDIMLAAHKNGKAVVTITEKQEAEKIVSVLRTAKLTAEVRQV